MHLARTLPSKMEPVKTLSHSAGFLGGVFDPVSQRYLAGCIDGKIVACAWPGLGTPSVFSDEHKSYVHLLTALPKRQVVASAGYDRRVIWWEAKTGRKIREAATVGRPLGIAISPDESKLALVGDDRILRLYDNQTGDRLTEWASGHSAVTAKGNLSSVYSVAFSPDRRLIASGDRTGAIVVREVATEKILQTISVSRLYSDFNRLPDGSARVGEYELGGVRSLIFTADGKTLIAGGMDQYDPTSAGIDGKMGLFGFEPTTGKPIFELTLSRGKGYLQAMLIHPSGALIAAGGGGVSGSGKGAFCVVDLANPRDAAIYEVEMTIRALALASDNKHLITAGLMKTAAAGRLEIWDLGTADK